jgi:hypothetical protein
VVDADVAAEVAAVAAAAGLSADLPDVNMADAASEVRAPIASYEDQMIDPESERRRMQAAIVADEAAMRRRMSFDRPVDAAGAGAGSEKPPEPAVPSAADGQAINQLFAPPSYNDQSPFFQVIEKGKAEGKWVLVNIQQAEVFASHTLNRDVWNDDTIKDVVQGSFLFWQRDDKSTEGDQFCQYYQCGHQLPHICVIDPRTGRLVKNWDGRKWTELHAASEYLFSFLDEFSMSRSPPALSPAGSPNLQPQAAPSGGVGKLQLTGLDVDEDLATAVAASLASASGAPGAGESVVADENDAMEEDAPPEEPVADMPAEPAESAECLKVSFRLPSGQRVVRRFLRVDTVEQMFMVASALAERPPSAVDLNTQFPKRSLRDVEGGMQALIKDVEVANSQILVSVRSA